MKLPLKITLRHMKSSPGLEEAVREKASKLDDAHPLTRCEVVVEAPHKHARHGWQYSARVALTVPGAEITVTREHDEDPYVAIKNAFVAARRQLEEQLDRRRAARHVA